MSSEYSDVIMQAKDYYDSDDADEFYYNIWGGEDFHLGIYHREDEPIFDASRRTVKTMAGMVSLDKTTKVLDIGAGYGGAARYLAQNHGCKVWCLNLSEKENERNRQKNGEQKLEHLIEVHDGCFEELPFEDEFFDVVWSEDAILHSGEKDRVISEAVRVMRRGGEFVFTDPMQADDCPEGVLQPVLDRINLQSMGSMKLYRELAAQNGLEEVLWVDLAKHLPRHYARVRTELEKRYDQLLGTISREYLDNMLAGLTHWVNAGNNGYLNWAMLYFVKR
ncbi:MAG: methyltransferase domain-containing protein [Dehalococcoidia bacterium]